MRTYEALVNGSIGPDGKQVRAGVTGDRDPGYGSTSKMISECALCLLRDTPDVPAGFWTPGAAMQHKLIKRLVDHAGRSGQLLGLRREAVGSGQVSGSHATFDIVGQIPDRIGLHLGLVELGLSGVAAQDRLAHGFELGFEPLRHVFSSSWCPATLRADACDGHVTLARFGTPLECG